MSFIEVMVATSVLAIFFTSVITFFAQQRQFNNSFAGLNQCRAALSRAVARIDSGGGGYNLPDLGSTLTLQTNPTNPSIYNFNTATKVSQNPLLPVAPPPRTYADRFQQFLANTASPSPRLFDLNATQTYARKDGSTLTPDQNGILLYTPLLMQGAVADLADLYDLPSYRGGPASPLPNIFQSPEDPVSALLQMRIQRYPLNLGSTTINEFTGSGHFWPIPRIQFGIPGVANNSYEIRDTSDQALRFLGIGPGMEIAALPTNPNILQMNWDYGFLVTLSLNNYQPDPNVAPVNCNLQKEYSLPPAYHNTMSFQSDFDMLTNPAQPIDSTTGLSTKQRIDTLRMSNKQDLLNTLGVAGLANPVSTIFTNVSVNSADGTNNRPVCTQDSSIDTNSATINKPITVRLSFKNVAKEPGAIPMCLDLSGIPSGLRNADGSDYQWCPSDITKKAEVKIISPTSGGASPAQQGWVPCEKLMLCHRAPDAVQIAVGPSPDSIEYTYQFNFITDKNDSRNNLWGCMMSVQTAVLDPLGNLAYVPAGDKVPNIENGAIGSAKTAMAAVPPFIYFKPPPCYSCKCKNCKGGKNLLGLILGLIILVVAVVFAQPELFSVFTDAFATAAWGAADLSTIATLAIGGVAISATSACFFQAAGATNGGLCSDSNPITYTAGGYNACQDSDNGCSCGHTCNRLVPPDPYGGAYDTSLITTPPLKPTCVYNNGATTAPAGNVLPNTGGYAWQVQMGLHDSTGISRTLTASLGQLSSYTMLDNYNGFYCLSERVCAPDTGSPTLASWQVYTDPAEGFMEGCMPIKVGTQIIVGGNSISPGPAKCIKPDQEFNNPALALQDFTAFDCQAFNGAGIYNKAALAGATSFGPYSGIAGKSGGYSYTPYYAVPGLLPPVSPAFPVVLPAAGNCAPTTSCSSGSCLKFSSPFSFTPGEGQVGAPWPDGGGHYVSNDCGPATSNPTGCPAPSCYQIGVTATCTSDPLYGACAYNSGSNSCYPVSMPTCYDYTHTDWYGWQKCEPPTTDLRQYMFDNSTMMSFETFVPTVAGSTAPSGPLALCPGIDGAGLPSIMTVDVTCSPTGACCGGSCP